MCWRVLLLPLLSLCRDVHGKALSLRNISFLLYRLVYYCLLRLSSGQAESEVVNSHVHHRSPPPSLPLPLPSSTPSLPHNSGDRSTHMTAIAVGVLSVLCVGVLVMVVIVLIVRIRRGWRRWRHKASSTSSCEEVETVSGSVTVHLLSTSVTTQHLEWCRPRSLSPASPPPPSLPRSPTPSSLPHNPSPLSHDYSETSVTTDHFEWCRPRSLSPASSPPPSLPPSPTPSSLPHNPSPLPHDYSETSVTTHHLEWCRPRSLTTPSLPPSPTPSSLPHNPSPLSHDYSETSVTTHHLEWCRPRSLTTPSLPPSPTPSSLPHNSSPLSHDYSEIASPSPEIFPVAYPPSRKPHVYDEIVDNITIMSGADRRRENVSGGVVERNEAMRSRHRTLHQYSILEEPSQQNSIAACSRPSSSAMNQQLCGNVSQDGQNSMRQGPKSSWDSSSPSRGSSSSIQDNCPKRIFPQDGSSSEKQSQQRPPRHVEPYRVSLILPSWEGGDRAPFYPALAGRGKTSSYNALEVSGRYNHLLGVGDYSSLENGVYATLEPFIKAEAMRPRSHSCDARLYNHLQY